MTKKSLEAEIYRCIRFSAYFSRAERKHNTRSHSTMMRDQIKVIAYDEDDTLWINEPFFTEAEEKFCRLMEHHMVRDAAHKELFAREIGNLPQYGYGIKAFMLSMIELA